MVDNPVSLFTAWLSEAEASEPNDPNAVALATVDAHGNPSVRMVLLKGHGPEGFVFYTNGESRKADALRATGRAALLFHWKTLRRQVRVEGKVEEVSADLADAYWATRSRPSQLGAWASDQSRPLDSRETFERRVADAEARFAGVDVPRPPHWGGWRVAPERIELWQDREYRLHERRLFVRDGADGWSETLLYP